MGSGGTEFEAGDIFESTRLNQKTRFVGGDLQLTNLVTSPQAGQQAFIKTSGATYIKNKIATRNAANDIWNGGKPISPVTGTLGTLATQGGGVPCVNNRVYTDGLTLPTSEKFYLITNMDANLSSDVANVVYGIDILNGNHAVLMALSRQFTTTGVAGTFSASFVSKPIMGGTTIYPWVAASATLSTQIENAGDASYKAITYTSTPNYGDATTISTFATSGIPGYKIYYTGYT